MSFFPVDANGKPTATANKIETSYRSLGRSRDGTETFGIELKNPDGKVGPSMMAFVKDRNNVVLDFPGMGATRLTRLTK